MDYVEEHYKHDRLVVYGIIGSVDRCQVCGSSEHPMVGIYEQESGHHHAIPWLCLNCIHRIIGDVMEKHRNAPPQPVWG